MMMVNVVRWEKAEKLGRLKQWKAAKLEAG